MRGMVAERAGCRWPSWAGLLLGCLLLLALLSVFGAARAQVEPTKFPQYRTVDEAHVDVASTSFFYEMTDMSIGPAQGGLAHSWTSLDGAIPPIRDSWAVGLTSGLAADCGLVNVWPDVRQISHLDGVSCFEVSTGGSFSNISGDGSTLSLSGSTYTFHASNGTAYTIDGCQIGAIIRTSSAIVFPDGRKVDVLFDNLCRIRRSPTIWVGGCSISTKPTTPPIQTAFSCDVFKGIMEQRWPVTTQSPTARSTHHGRAPTTRGRATYLPAPILSPIRLNARLALP